MLLIIFILWIGGGEKIFLHGNELLFMPYKPSDINTLIRLVFILAGFVGT
tara:strand:- start:1 stop:150 length:150 start_codon:yes stop_codon:yes gene_type:complete